MGVHLCKDFIPLRNDTPLSREPAGGEFYYEYKVFLNCQSFQLNADRNVITNEESDEIAWIWDDFQANVWPDIQARTNPYNAMKRAEEAGIESIKKTNEAASLKSAYVTSPNVKIAKSAASLAFVKQPRKEADVSHLLAMMVQSGHWKAELDPIDKFGQYINASTDVLVEDAAGTVLLVEIETQLANLFRHQHPMNSYDMVVVWSLGTMTSGTSQNAPWGTNRLHGFCGAQSKRYEWVGTEMGRSFPSGSCPREYPLRAAVRQRRKRQLNEPTQRTTRFTKREWRRSNHRPLRAVPRTSAYEGAPPRPSWAEASP
ncbi:hypothetical protein GCM10025868_27290 [Angustibacter aerolatus]|uniref:Uncharacterized protein n=1 Tax=Angustibacter aerolatus TaxID=1162965 RepID=A0ABQ6JI18_9ACTN|nr:hypothetical protein [Angustibacter aerolatus]GMA87479.1 hypothetical protein GCM10025868_27290 [Angustibacter aerolatus]